VAQLSGQNVSAVAQWHAIEFAVAGAAMIATAIAPLAGEGWRLLIPSERVTACGLEALTPLSDAMLNQWQVEAAVPAYGHELSTDYIPLEAGLEQAISFKKGCYVGKKSSPVWKVAVGVPNNSGRDPAGVARGDSSDTDYGSWA
jgi:folate-binding Fe-S cluster repair protein YgfZ